LDIDGSLFVVVIGPIVDVQSESSHQGQPPIRELAVVQGSKEVAIGFLTQKFIISNCPTLGGKPKIFLMLDTAEALDDRRNLAEVKSS
jgi:hypothetical protein